MRKKTTPAWTSMFYVAPVNKPRDKERYWWAVFRKGEKLAYNDRFYSQEIDAKRGAAQIYRHFMKSFEKNILGQ